MWSSDHPKSSRHPTRSPHRALRPFSKTVLSIGHAIARVVIGEQERLKTTPLRWIAARILLTGLAPVATLQAEVEAREIIRRAVAADERNWKAVRNYGFSERVDARHMDPDGRVKSRDVKTYDVILVEGSHYRRLIGRDDAPLPPREERKQQEEFARNVAERRRETSARRSGRLAEHQRRPEWQREAWRVLPEAFDFQFAGEEVWESRGVYAIRATPRRDYEPRSYTARVMTRLQGTLWVDKHDYRLVRANVEALDTISAGLFLIRLAKGSHATFEQTRVTDTVWMPSRVQVSATARLGLLKVLRVEQEVIYGNSREFDAAPSVSLLRRKQTGAVRFRESEVPE